MKFTVFTAALSVAMLVGCSHVHESKRIPASEKFPCGLRGSVQERMTECSNQLTSKKEGFILVTRTKDFKEVHQEIKTGLLWGDRLPSTMVYKDAKKACKADLADVGTLSGLNWRLPSIEEFEEAEKNGIRKSLPNMDYRWWWSSSAPRYHNGAMVFSGIHGGVDFENGDVNQSVRCVAMWW